jgi:hypothetical protein
MNEITIREMRADETPLLVRWLYEYRETNLVDLTPFRKNQVRVYVAEKPDGPVYFFPVRFDYHFDAGAPRPGVSSFELAQAFSAMNEFMKGLAATENVGNAFVEPSDARFSAFLQKLGYQPVTRETLQMKFNELKPTETAQCPTE